MVKETLVGSSGSGERGRMYDSALTSRLYRRKALYLAGLFVLICSACGIGRADDELAAFETGDQTGESEQVEPSDSVLPAPESGVGGADLGQGEAVDQALSSKGPLSSTTVAEPVPKTVSPTTKPLSSTTIGDPVPKTVPSTTRPLSSMTMGDPVPKTVPPPLPPLPPSDSAGTVFFEDFSQNSFESTFEFGIYHRDDHLVSVNAWQGDHPGSGIDGACGSPKETRSIARGNREQGFNDDWIYRCLPAIPADQFPNGDPAKAHVMTSIGDTSGYSVGAFAPKPVFTDVTEVRWAVNQTDLGDRQWTEVAIVPVDNFQDSSGVILSLNQLSLDNDPGNQGLARVLPCSADVACDSITHDALGSVGTQWGGLRHRNINTPQNPNGVGQDEPFSGYDGNCDCVYGYGVTNGQPDPALLSNVIRLNNIFKDNRDGTITWSLQLSDGTWNHHTVQGSFPRGEVKVVFMDHNYTPMKSPANMLPTTTFSWHWDNIQVIAAG